MTTATWLGRPVTGVLFDLDDTLVDHRGAVERGLRVWLGGLGLDGLLEEHVERWFTLEAFHYERVQRGEISHAEQRRARIRGVLPALGPAGRRRRRRRVRAATWPATARPGRRSTTPARRWRGCSALGLPVGILTNGDQSAQEEKVRRTGLASYDVPVYASSSLPAAKPDPRAFHTACADLGVDPAGVVMVGDSLRHDVEGARAAGMAGVLIDRIGRYRARRGARRAAEIEVLPPSSAGERQQPLASSRDRSRAASRAARNAARTLWISSSRRAAAVVPPGEVTCSRSTVGCSLVSREHLRRADQGLDDQLVRGRPRQTEVHAGLDHRLDDEEDVGRTRAR